MPSTDGTRRTYVLPGDWKKWAVSTQNLILAVFKDNSPHYSNFVSVMKTSIGFDRSLNTLYGIFSSAKEDFEGGYVFDVDLRVSGEIFGDFVSMAKQSLNEGYKA